MNASKYELHPVGYGVQIRVQSLKRRGEGMRFPEISRDLVQLQVPNSYLLKALRSYN